MGFRCRLIVGALLGVLCTLPVFARPYVAGGTQWKPYAYEDENGQLLGISIDIARRVTQLAGIDATFVSYPVNRLQSMLKKGEIDINYADALIWNSPEELSHYLFSEPYSVVQEHLYFLADHPAKDLRVAQMDHLLIGMVRGYTYVKLDPALTSHRLSRLETSQDEALIKLLQNHRVDAVAMVDDIFDNVVSTNHLDPSQFHQGAKLSEAQLVFKLQPQYAQWLEPINSAINTLSKSGELDRIFQHYLPGSRSARCASSGQVC